MKQIENIGNALPANDIKQALQVKYKLLLQSVITSGDDYMLVFNTRAQMDNADYYLGDITEDYCERLKYISINQLELKQRLKQCKN